MKTVGCHEVSRLSPCYTSLHCFLACKAFFECIPHAVNSFFCYLSFLFMVTIAVSNSGKRKFSSVIPSVPLDAFFLLARDWIYVSTIGSFGHG